MRKRIRTRASRKNTPKSSRERPGSAPGGSRRAPGRSWSGSGRPKSALRVPLGRAGSVPSVPPSVPGSIRSAPSLPRSIFHRFWLDFGASRTLSDGLLGRFFINFSWSFDRFWASISLPVTPFIRSTDRVRPTKRKKKRTRRFRVRPAFCCSSLPARSTRCTPQLANQPPLRCAKASAPSQIIIIYLCQIGPSM